LPALAVDQTSGNLAITWYDARNDPANTAVQYFGTVSTNGGVTFLPNVQISSGQTDSSTANNGIGIGDYTRVAFDNNVFYPMWADNSSSLTDNPDLPNLDMATAAVQVSTPTGILRGTVFEDHDGNGTMDTGDQGLANWTVRLETINNIVLASTTTGTDGSYTFNNLAPGTYRIREVVKAGWLQTTINPADVLVTAGHTSTAASIGDFQLGSVKGTTFTDVTGDGFSDDDPAQGGVTVTLYQDANGNGTLDGADTISSATTSAASGSGTGTYSFSGLTAGTYFVRETPPTGYIQSAPPSPTYYTLTVVSGTAVLGDDFDNFKTFKITGTTFNDLTGDGFSGDDVPVGGATVNLYLDDGSGTLDANDKLFGTVVTPASEVITGFYSFNNLGPGIYFVQETPPSGYAQTAPTGPSYYTIQTSPSDVTNQNFDNFKAVTISGTTLTDLTGDGLSADDAPLGNVTVSLYKDTGDQAFDPSTDTLVTTQTTPGSGAGKGTYSFNGLGPGLYFVEETPPNGYVQTAPTSPSYYSVTATSNSDVTNANFDNFQGVVISGTTFTDITGNGFSADDTPLGNVTILVFKDNGDGIFDPGTDSVVASQSTQAGGPGVGTYTTGGLSIGTYFVEEIPPSGYVQTAPSSPSYYTVVASTGGTVITNRNFDNFQASISGTTLTDVTGNGLSGDDTALGNVTVTLYKDNGDGVFNPAQDTVAGTRTTPTSGQVGTSSFSGLLPGTYFVQETAPAGYVQTDPLSPATYKVTISSSGAAFANKNFVNFKTITISGTTLKDITNDGFTGDDTPLGGMVVTLYKDNGNGVFDPAQDAVVGTPQTTPTSCQVGTYSFTGVGPGTYFVQETPPGGYIQSAPTGPSYYTIAATSGTNVRNQNFDNFQTTTVSGTTLQDFTNDGFTGDDTPLGGMVVTLYKDDGDGVFNPALDSVVGTPQTTPGGGTCAGGYSFAVLTAGTYFIQETPPTGVIQTAPTGTNYYTITVTGTPTIITNKNFDNFKTITISGTTFTDLTGNGLSADDTPIGGAQVTLYQDNGDNVFNPAQDTVVDTKTSLSSGAVGTYSFSGVLPGTYFVVQAPPSGYVQSAPSSPSYYTVKPVSGTNVTKQDFDDFKSASVSGTTFSDPVGNGILASGTPLGNVTVNLYRDTNGNGGLDAGDATAQAPQVTGTNGLYAFANLGPGTYFVQETVPGGYVLTTPAFGY
jgi:uncharacterized protein (DUF2141 family)